MTEISALEISAHEISAHEMSAHEMSYHHGGHAILRPRKFIVCVCVGGGAIAPIAPMHMRCVWYVHAMNEIKQIPMLRACGSVPEGRVGILVM